MDIDPSVEALTPTQIDDLQDKLDKIAVKQRKRMPGYIEPGDAPQRTPKSHATEERRVTLSEFAASVDCSLTTASRLRSGERMPGRVLFNNIVRVYDLDPAEALEKFLGSRVGFSQYLHDKVFMVTQADLDRDRDLASIRHEK